MKRSTAEMIAATMHKLPHTFRTKDWQRVIGKSPKYIKLFAHKSHLGFWAKMPVDLDSFTIPKNSLTKKQGAD